VRVSQAAAIAEKARRADRRAEELLASAAGEEALAMYRELGFLCLVPKPDDYGYLLYPHRPIVAFDTRTGEPLSEFCVRFLDAGDAALPDADDLLAKWMALRADEKLVIGESNIDRLGHQLDPTSVRRDLRTLELWRLKHAGEWGQTA